MKICIDARMYGIKHAGIGRYVENLVANILKEDRENNYVLLVRKEDSSSRSINYLVDKYPKKLKLLTIDVKHYTVKEQLLLPWMLNKIKPDLMHFPHFNVPLLYSGKFVVTIHDLLWHDMKGREVTTLPGYLYDIKYAGYRLVFANAVKRAQKILVPSEWVKNKLIDTYNINKDKIIVTYEGVDSPYLSSQRPTVNSQQLLSKYSLTEPFLIYTGSAYPHKNLRVLLEVIRILNNDRFWTSPSTVSSGLPNYQNDEEKNSSGNIQLLIACSRDVFWERLQKMIREFGIEKQVRLPGFVPDEDLQLLYQNAVAFVFPSLSEGFGLPGLEAMASGCPVLCSDIPVFHEIYQNAALYFNPQNVSSLNKNVELLIKNVELRQKMSKKGLEQAKKYSWEKMAKKTLEVYQKV